MLPQSNLFKAGTLDKVAELVSSRTGTQYL